MSVKLFSLFVRNLKQNLPWTIKPGFQIRHISAMEIATTITDAADASPAKEQEIVPTKNHTRFKQRFHKRQWDEPNPHIKENGESEEKKQCERIKRKKMAMILGYNGVDYHGMQRNPGVPTIEEELLKALFDAKYITEEDFANQQTAQFQRSSRTDKGVSAARQIVSLKLPLEVNVEEINKRLPECIRVFGVKRVTNKFNSKSKCNARTYSYTLPTFTFEPSLVTDEERKGYRITSEKLEQVNYVLSSYRGTKSYHNFTEKKHFQDPSSLRYMMGFSIDKQFVSNDMEFVVLTVKGQSFMLHQIRKMVGLMIAVVRGLTDSSIMDKAFGKEKVMIPTAPGLGLVLDKVHYERYDAKFKDSHDSLTWDDAEPAIQQFKHDHIYPTVVNGELQGNMATWLEKLSRHSFEPSDDVPEGKADGDGNNDDDVDNNDNGKNVNDEKNSENLESSGDDGNNDSSKGDDSEGKSRIIDNSVIHSDETTEIDDTKSVVSSVK